MKRALAGIIAVALVGCVNDEVHDVAYYVKHQAERTAQIEKCTNNPGQMAIEPNCINAGSALWKASMSSHEMAKLE